MSYRCKENVIEWIEGDKSITCTFSQKKFINRVMKLAETEKDVVVMDINEDGSILAKLPINALHLTIHKSNSKGNIEALAKARERQEVVRNGQ